MPTRRAPAALLLKLITNFLSDRYLLISRARTDEDTGSGALRRQRLPELRSARAQRRLFELHSNS